MLDLVAALEDCSVRDAAVKVADWFGVETSAPKSRRAARNPGSSGMAATRPPKTSAGPDAVAMGSEPVLPENPERESGSSAGDPTAQTDQVRPAANRPLTFELKLDPSHPWFAEVGLRPETVREFGIGFCAKGMMGGRVAFPIRNAAGELIGYAGRWPGDPPEGQPLWKYPTGLDLGQVVYPAERLAETSPGQALFANDPLRVVLCWQLGVKGVFFVPGDPGIEECTAAINRARGC